MARSLGVPLRRYLIALCEVDNLPEGAFANPSPRVNYPAIFVRPWPQNNVAVFYINADDATGWDRLAENLREEVPRLVRGASIQKIITHREWRYFPHFQPEDLRSGVYDRLESRQGRNHTYFTGGLMHFENVWRTVEYSRGLVRRFF
jgi:hypothetical protein